MLHRRHFPVCSGFRSQFCGRTFHQEVNTGNLGVKHRNRTLNEMEFDRFQVHMSADLEFRILKIFVKRNDIYFNVYIFFVLSTI